MYLDYFGLERPPFQITPDTSQFYGGSERSTALAALIYAIEHGCTIIKVIGEVGAGKTMLCRKLAYCLSENIDIAYISNPSLSPEDILQMIALELNISIKPDWKKVQLMQAIVETLLKKHTIGKKVVVFIEEAQSMPLPTLEEIRLLSNLETDEAKLLQIVLFGQPELDINLAKQEIRQFKERINYSIYLKPFEKKDIANYLDFRLRNAGYQGPSLFNEKISNIISKYSKGLARRINIIADKALLIAFMNRRHNISKKDILLAAKDSEFTQMTYFNRNTIFFVICILLFLIGTVSLAINSKQTLQPSPTISTTQQEHNKGAAL